MKEIKTSEIAIKQSARGLEEPGINAILSLVYRTGRENENEPTDFNEVTQDYDIKDISKTFRASNITGFTIGSTSSSLIEALAAFEK